MPMRGTNVEANLLLSLNLIPPTKGIYTLSIVPQPGRLKINDSNVPIGLKVNSEWKYISSFFMVEPIVQSIICNIDS